MKKLALAALFAASASTAFAGGMAEPVMEVEMEPVVIVEDTEAASSGAGLIIPLILIALIAAASQDS